MSDPKNHYDVLGIARDASSQDIRKAYRALALKYHPDKLDAALSDAQREAALNQFKLANEANRILSDTDLRQAYDRELDNSPAPSDTFYSTTTPRPDNRPSWTASPRLEPMYLSKDATIQDVNKVFKSLKDSQSPEQQTQIKHRSEPRFDAEGNQIGTKHIFSFPNTKMRDDFLNQLKEKGLIKPTPGSSNQRRNDAEGDDSTSALGRSTPSLGM